jgi:serine-type D-Ala-D-Ala carboxypeptidase (penicillin-binding protein 5/6)
MRKKQIICALAALLLCGSAGAAGCASASPALLDGFGTHLDTLMTSKDKLSRLDGAATGLCVIENEDEFSEDDIEAPAGALFNITDQKTLYSKNANDEREIASITKIMTALLAMKYADLSQEITISYTPEGLESSAVLCGFEPGDKMLLSSLLSAALIYSGNDAAIDIAIAVSGSQEVFVDLMNQECKELMTSHTHFANPTGLTQSKHYSSVYDVYLMFQECLKYPTFRDSIARGSFLCYYTNAAGENVTKSFNSTNQYLVGAYTPPSGITIVGGKTGHTNTAGYNLVLLVQDSHHKEYIAVILGAESKDELYNQMNTLLSKI